MILSGKQSSPSLCDAGPLFCPESVNNWFISFGIHLHDTPEILET